jgi:hypothetical protein
MIGAAIVAAKSPAKANPPINQKNQQASRSGSPFSVFDPIFPQKTVAKCGV